MGKNSTVQKEFVNKSLFLVVELKQSIPRHQFMLADCRQLISPTLKGLPDLLNSRPRIAPKVPRTFGASLILIFIKY
ncbi:hypothetical protein FAJ36_10160 [Streptococcus suis]|uniref:Uncharacterized protein n=1 Tax=Streptococcus suis TaxID=1307 RepID=A0A4T2GU40_STRSU|nr:hypothetical protein FAJ36_10160 [Streptococcus suis]